MFVRVLLFCFFAMILSVGTAGAVERPLIVVPWRCRLGALGSFRGCGLGDSGSLNKSNFAKLDLLPIGRERPLGPVSDRHCQRSAVGLRLV